MQTKNEPTKKNLFEIIGKLPYRLGTEERTQKMREVREKNIPPIEVNCFGLPKDKYEILGVKKVRQVRVFNEVMGYWQIVDAVEYEDLCPICGTLMLVRAIRGSTWLALCSEECTQKYNAL